MSNVDSPAIGAKAIATMVYGGPEFTRRVHNDLQQKRLPVVYVGRTALLYPETWEKFRQQQEEANSSRRMKAQA